MWHSSPGLQTRHPSCAMDQQYPSRRVVSPLSPLSPLSLEDPSGIPSSLSPITPPSPTPVSHQHHGSFSHRCIPQSPPHIRRPLLNFPPPPAYPPPHPHHAGHHPVNHHHHGQLVREQDCLYRDRGNPERVEEFTVIQIHQSARDDLGQPCQGLQPITEDLNLPGPSHQRGPQPSTSWDTGEIFPNDYSYAYYEPGPPTKHTNVPHRHPITGYRDRHSRHTYLTRYGTEENIYEEISDHARARMLLRPSQQQSMISLNQSIIEEEVRRVQHRHRKVLGELNLSVEAMLMPASSSQDEDTDKEMDDQLADLLTVGPTDELLSPAPPLDLDSGFSGSSSGTSYVGSMRRGPDRYKNKCNSLKKRECQ